MTEEFKHSVIKWLNTEYNGDVKHCEHNRDIYYRNKHNGSISFVYDIQSNTMLFRDENPIQRLTLFFGIDITEIKDILKTWTSQKFNIERNVDFRFSMFMRIKM
jgi:hypothetical protein